MSQPASAALAWKSAAIGTSAVAIMVELMGLRVLPSASGATKRKPNPASASTTARARGAGGSPPAAPALTGLPGAGAVPRHGGGDSGRSGPAPPF